MIRLPSIRPIPIFFHTDTDGCCSATLVADWLERKNVELSLHPKNAGTIHKVRTGIYLDLAGIPPNQVTEHTIVIDHHPGPELPCQYFNPRSRGEKWPASQECFRLLGRKELVWVAAAGCVGDGQPMPEYEKKTKELYGSVDLMRVADLIDAHCSVHGLDGVKEVVGLMLKFRESPHDFLKQKNLLQSWSKVETELSRILSKKPKIVGKLLILKFKSDLKIKSQVANNLKDRYPQYILIAAQEVDDQIKLSLRQVKQITDFSEVLPRITSDLKAEAGGHPVAAGGSVLKSDYNRFIERLANEVG